MTPTSLATTGASPEARLAAFVDACGGAVRQTGKETVCHCPAHDDENPSLNVRIGESGKLLIKCRAGCDNAAVVARIGWTLQDLAAPAGDRKPRRPTEAKQPVRHGSIESIAAAAARWQKGEVESTHVYLDEHGAPAFGVVRVRCSDGGKQIPQIRPDAGGWVFGGIDAPRPLYRLPELLGHPEAAVSMFEGEQKADLAASLGLVATTCSQGAGNAKLTNFAPLAGRAVYLFSDNDDAGELHMQDVALRSFAAGAASVWSVQLPDLPPKGDLVDFVNVLREAGVADEQIATQLGEAISTAAQIDGEALGDVGKPEEPANRMADVLVRLAADATLFHDDHDRYATIPVGDHFENWRIGSDRFGRWLVNRYYRIFKKAVTPNALTTAIGQLEAMAQFDGELQPVHSRIAHLEGSDAIWLDLGNDRWQAVEITARGWRVVDEPAVRFTRTSGMRALPVPVSGSAALDALFDLLHFDDEQLRLLVTAWLVNCIMDVSSYPILALTGEQGSGKTTFSRALQRLIDPHAMEGRSPPRNEEDIAVAAQHAHVLVYENLSGISTHLSDSLCRVATGAGFAARKLYSDADERQLTFCRPIIINGIDDLATRSDLADRIVNVPLMPIPRGKRQTEVDLWATFADLQPELLGALLDISVSVLGSGPVTAPRERMAEYSVIGAKVAMALGLEPTTFADAYRTNRDDASLTALESSAVGPILLRIARGAPFRGLISGLLHLLHDKASVYERRHPDWPATPRALGSELRRLSPNLGRVGVAVEFLGHRRDGTWVAITETSATDSHNRHDDHAEVQAQ